MIGVGLLILALVLVGQATADGTDWIFEYPTNVTDWNTTEQQQIKKGVADELYLWPDGDDGNPLVPYIFFDDVNQTDVQAGLDHWMEHTCIKFEETNNTMQPHLVFYIGTGCWSYVGMYSSMYGQAVSIGNNCNRIGTVVHTVGHAIGFHLESSSQYRDNYITVLWDNVQESLKYGYDKFLDNNYGVPYDLHSVMHNSIWWFTKNNNPTMVTKDPMHQQIPNIQKNELSHRDKLLANRMYDCIDNWLADCNIPSDPCLNDGYTGKNCTCICPPGTNGSLCEIITGDYYGQQLNPRNERISSEMTINISAPLAPGIFAKVITPPASCHRAILKFTYSNMNSSCVLHHLVVRTDPKDDYGQMMCASDVSPNVTITSDTEIIVTMVNFFNFQAEQIFWQADVTFARIDGCTTTTPSPSCPLDPGPACPECPSTPAPPRPAPISECVFAGVRHLLVLPKGESIIITSPRFPDPYPRTRIACGWKLKAAKGGSLDINCDTFDISPKDRVKLRVPTNLYFRDDHALSSNPNIAIIKFRSWRRNSGPGFRCTVVSE